MEYLIGFAFGCAITILGMSFLTTWLRDTYDDANKTLKTLRAENDAHRARHRQFSSLLDDIKQAVDGK